MNGNQFSRTLQHSNNLFKLYTIAVIGRAGPMSFFWPVSELPSQYTQRHTVVIYRLYLNLIKNKHYNVAIISMTVYSTGGYTSTTE